jgi:hypothetical protein
MLDAAISPVLSPSYKAEATATGTLLQSSEITKFLLPSLYQASVNLLATDIFFFKF